MSFEGVREGREDANKATGDKFNLTISDNELIGTGTIAFEGNDKVGKNYRGGSHTEILDNTLNRLHDLRAGSIAFR